MNTGSIKVFPIMHFRWFKNNDLIKKYENDLIQYDNDLDIYNNLVDEEKVNNINNKCPLCRL